MRYIRDGNKKTGLQYFDGFTTLANTNVSLKNLPKWRNTTSSCKPGRECMEWYGVHDIPTLRGYVELYGWEEGAIKGKEVLGHIKAPSLPSIKRKRCRGAYGHTLNMTSIYNGNLDKAWSTSKKITSEGRKKKTGNVNIVIDVAASFFNDAEKFFWRGAVGCMLARALQKSGRNVCIYAGASSYGLVEDRSEAKYISTYIKLKDYGMPLSLERLFSMTALAGFFRYYIFKAWCALPHKVESCLGSPRALKESDLAQIVDDNPVIVVSDIWTENQAKNVVNTLLERFQ